MKLGGEGCLLRPAEGRTHVRIIQLRLSGSNSCLHVVPQAHDPGYFRGDPPDSTPMAEVLRFGGERAVQHIRALPCAAGSVVQFSHRLLHWGSAAESGPAVTWRPTPEPPRVALSFASTDATFEKPFLAHPMPMPPAATRAALIASLGLLYAQSDPPTPFRRALFWDVVRCNKACFESTFYQMIRRNAHAADAAQSQASGLAGAGGGGGDEAGGEGGAEMRRQYMSTHVSGGAAAASGAAAPTPMAHLQGAAAATTAEDGSYLMFTGTKLAAKLVQLGRLHADGGLSDAQYEKAKKDVVVARMFDPGFAPLARE